MSTSVYLRLKDGRLISLKESTAQAEAEDIKQHLDQWLQRGMTVSVTDAHGHVEDITPRRVLSIELIES